LGCDKGEEETEKTSNLWDEVLMEGRANGPKKNEVTFSLYSSGEVVTREEDVGA